MSVHVVMVSTNKYLIEKFLVSLNKSFGVPQTGASIAVAKFTTVSSEPTISIQVECSEETFKRILDFKDGFLACIAHPWKLGEKY